MEERSGGRPRPGDAVGLGRVVSDAAGLAHGPDDRIGGGDGQAADAALDEASEESFPASDAPGLMSDAPSPRDPERVEPPDPRDVP